MGKKTQVERTIVIQGPLTNAEIKEIWSVVRAIERKRPHQRFRLVVDDRNNPVPPDLREQMDVFGNLAEGYARVVGVALKPPKSKMN